MFTVMELDVLFLIMTICCRCVRKLRTQLQMPVSMFSDLSFSNKMMVLKAELTLMKRTQA